MAEGPREANRRVLDEEMVRADRARRAREEESWFNRNIVTIWDTVRIVGAMILWPLAYRWKGGTWVEAAIGFALSVIVVLAFLLWWKLRTSRI